MRFVFQLAIILAVTSLPLPGPSRGAEVTPPGPAPRDTLVRVKYAPGGQLGVIGMRGGSFIPADAYVDSDAGMLVFTGPPGSYLVHGLESGQLVQLIVQIGGAAPEPDDDEDDTPPDDDTTPPDVPESISDIMGVGKAAYREAAKIRNPQQAAELASVYRNCEIAMHQGSMLPAVAAETVKTKAYGLGSLWATWHNQTLRAVQQSLDKHGTGIVTQKNIWREIRLALEAVAQ